MDLFGKNIRKLFFKFSCKNFGNLENLIGCVYHLPKVFRLRAGHVVIHFIHVTLTPMNCVMQNFVRKIKAKSTYECSCLKVFNKIIYLTRWLPSRHLLVQCQQWKHKNNWRNLLKGNNDDTIGNLIWFPGVFCCLPWNLIICKLFGKWQSLLIN